MVLEHPSDVQALDVEDVELMNESMSDLVMKVPSRSLNILMGFGKKNSRSLASVALARGDLVVMISPRPSLQSALGDTQFRLGLLERTRIGDRRVIIGKSS